MEFSIKKNSHHFKFRNDESFFRIVVIQYYIDFVEYTDFVENIGLVVIVVHIVDELPSIVEEERYNLDFVVYKVHFAAS